MVFFGNGISKKLSAWQLIFLILIMIGLIFLFGERTAACTKRTGPVGTSVDRTSDCPTVKEGTAPSDAETAEANLESLGREQVLGKPKPSIELTFDVSGRQTMRRDNGLSLIEGETDLLGEMPEKTWGYINDGSLVTVWRARTLNTLTVRNHAPDLRFELQKRNGGVVYVVGFIRGDIARSIHDKASFTGTMKVSAKRYRPTDALVAIPIERIQTIDSDEIAMNAGRYIRVLVIGIG